MKVKSIILGITTHILKALNPLIWIIIILAPFIYRGAETYAHMIYKNSEIQITFPGSFKEIKDVSFYATIDKQYKGFFLNVEKKILFHEDNQEKYYTTESGEQIETQHVVSSSGYLSDMYIYKAIDKASLLKEIDMAFGQKDSNFSYRKVEEVTRGELTVLNWRTQFSKNRFEYYMVLGETYYYLFVSTPYGEKDYIESILKSVKLLKE